ncbi:Ulp1 protease family, C-terminal catalytic domain containing protein [Trema orientale]|uniref:Ulp1 protease family, C-terminal catalytic domain containing protein n=1 Tax=Trema orientale TaxID=63057 RepID=A0A2P5FL34_TREOI|nr:Ulp1 protease family, C-terminal catalytic domain containing protein [Trema orientale]
MDLERDFSDWINIGLNKRARKIFYPGCDVLDPEFDFKIDVISSKSWFYKLSQPGQLLSDLHVDVMFYYLRKKALYHPNFYSVKCTTSSRVFNFYLVRAYDGMKIAASSPMYFDWIVEAAMCNYVMGYAYCGRPWADVDLVYMPILVTNNHWCLGVLDILEKKITIYDSIRGAKHDIEVRNHAEKYATMLPLLFIHLQFWDIRKDYHVGDGYAPFKVNG